MSCTAGKYSGNAFVIRVDKITICPNTGTSFTGLDKHKK